MPTDVKVGETSGAWSKTQKLMQYLNTEDKYSKYSKK